MVARLTLALALAVVGCTPQDEGDPARNDDPSPGGTEEPTTPPDSLTAEGVTASTEEDDTAVALDLASGLAVAFSEPQAADYSEDGRVDRRGPTSLQCVTAEIVDEDLVLDFDDCHGLDGIITLSFSLGGPTVMTFDDALTLDGDDLDGSLSVDVALREGDFALDGTVLYRGVDLTTEIDLQVGAGVTLWGFVDVATADASSRVDLGTEEDPLTYAQGCRCATGGALDATASATIEEIVVDLDAVVDPLNDEDDFPPLRVPVAPFTATVDAGIDYTGACEDVLVTVEADDVSVVMQKADLEAEIDAACDAGEIAPDMCDRLDRFLGNLADELTVTVPAEALAADVEAELQARYDARCAAS